MAEVESKLITVGKDSYEELIKRSNMLHSLVQVDLKYWENYPEALKLIGDEVPANMPQPEEKPVIERGRPVEPTAEEIAEMQAAGGIPMAPPPV